MSTRIKVVTEVGKERFFLDLEGRPHEIKVGRCVCMGIEGERWTSALASVERDRYSISEEDIQGFRE